MKGRKGVGGLNFQACYSLTIATTPQSMMNAKFSQQKFWHYHENPLSMTILMILRNLNLSFKSVSFHCGIYVKGNIT